MGEGGQKCGIGHVQFRSSCHTEQRTVHPHSRCLTIMLLLCYPGPLILLQLRSRATKVLGWHTGQRLHNRRKTQCWRLTVVAIPAFVVAVGVVLGGVVRVLVVGLPVPVIVVMVVPAWTWAGKQQGHEHGLKGSSAKQRTARQGIYGDGREVRSRE